jgi:hypothetical protein
MKSISGYVLVKETGAGISNLVVAAYDAEKAFQGAGEPGLSAQLFQQLGKRIGSVLTDLEGRFVLASEELEFQGNESRPDLSLVIFAPEDVQGIEQPYPLPPENRVLYVSTIPRVDAGAEEAFVIRLLQEQLDRFRISAGSSATRGSSEGDRLANAIESGWQFQDSLRQRLQPRLQREQEKTLEFKKLAQEKVQTLSAIPLHLRGDGLRNNKFLIKDRRDLAASLGPTQAAAIADGLKRLEHTAPILRLALTRPDLTDLGLKEEGGQITGKVDSLKVAEKVRSLMKGVDLVRVRGLNNPSPEELERKYLAAGAKTTQASGPA